MRAIARFAGVAILLSPVAAAALGACGSDTEGSPTPLDASSDGTASGDGGGGGGDDASPNDGTPPNDGNTGEPPVCVDGAAGSFAPDGGACRPAQLRHAGIAGGNCAPITIGDYCDVLSFCAAAGQLTDVAARAPDFTCTATGCPGGGSFCTFSSPDGGRTVDEHVMGELCSVSTLEPAIVVRCTILEK